MPLFRKKPVVIEAIRNNAGAADAVVTFLGGEERRNIHWSRNDRTGIVRIHTLEGVMTADLGDWIIRGVKGELYPCKPDIFDATYEPADPDNFVPTA